MTGTPTAIIDPELPRPSLDLPVFTHPTMDLRQRTFHTSQERESRLAREIDLEFDLKVDGTVFQGLGGYTGWVDRLLRGQGRMVAPGRRADIMRDPV